MKKLFLVLAFVLSGSAIFATSPQNTDFEVENGYGTCTYTIITDVYVGDSYAYSYETTYTTEASSLEDCIDTAQSHVSNLNG